jgi:dolichol-phosphate mannosyltransferase
VPAPTVTVPSRVLVVIPTYNEAENVGPILERLLTANPRAHALVVDDASPDGTGKLADEIAERDDRVAVLHRTAKVGLGAAYIAGFRWGLEREYDAIVEMDADGSHAPEQLPRLLNALADADLVLGARWIRGGRVENWPKSRELLSRGANIYTRMALGIGLHDSTAGFRAYRRRVLETLDLDEIESQGYCFQIDLALRTVAAGFRVTEVPITFAERELGTSKMTSGIITEALTKVAVWGAQRRRSQLAELTRRRVSSR